MVKTNPKLLVRILQDVLQRDDQVDTYADLADAFKCRCARLRVPYDSEAVRVAVDRLERGGARRLFSARVVRAETGRRCSYPSAPNGGGSGGTRQEAASILARVFARVA